jgi:hypothetical protein
VQSTFNIVLFISLTLHDPCFSQRALSKQENVNLYQSLPIIPILPLISNNMSLLTVSLSMAARVLRSCPIYAHAFPAMTLLPSGPKLSRYATPFLVPYTTFCPSNFSYALFPFYFTFLVLSHHPCLIIHVLSAEFMIELPFQYLLYTPSSTNGMH